MQQEEEEECELGAASGTRPQRRRTAYLGHRLDNGVDHLVLDGAKQHGSVADVEEDLAARGKHKAVRDFQHVRHGHNKAVS